MNIYSYKFVDKDGNVKKDKMQASNKREVNRYLRDKNCYVISINKVSFWNMNIKDIFRYNKFDLNKKYLSLFCKQMNFNLNAGLSIIMSIEIIYNQCENLILKNELLKIKEGLLKGESLSNTILMSNKFPILVYNMIKVGEKSGNLSEIMSILADYYEEHWKTIEDIKSVLLYPSIVFISMIIVVIFSMVYVVPTYYSIFMIQGQKLPLCTRILINISNFILSYYLILIILILMLILLIKITWNKYYVKKFRDILLLNIPYLKLIYIKLLNLRFTQIMSIMLNSGVQILESVSITKNVMNNYVTDKIMDKLSDNLKYGMTLEESMRNLDIFTPMLKGMISIGENTGNVADVLSKVYEYFSYDIKRNIKVLEKLIEPAITIILGLILTFIMIAIMLPTFSLTNIL